MFQYSHLSDRVHSLDLTDVFHVFKSENLANSEEEVQELIVSILEVGKKLTLSSPHSRVTNAPYLCVDPP